MCNPQRMADEVGLWTLSFWKEASWKSLCFKVKY